ncbi:MAG TPA: DUF2934 domain-containing protein [Opitutaceae bacterium]|nr:DUF2934 domain-containing protein [Opitutaceae bacterium]
MNTPELSEETGIILPLTDELAQWELRIAQRADQLAAKTERGRNHDLENWLQAEREVMGDFAKPPVDFAS